jgi:hypothetical protein
MLELPYYGGPVTVKIDPVAPGYFRNYSFSDGLANASSLKKGRPKTRAISLGAIDEVENKIRSLISTIGKTPTLCNRLIYEHKRIEGCAVLS